MTLLYAVVLVHARICVTGMVVQGQHVRPVLIVLLVANLCPLAAHQHSHVRAGQCVKASAWEVAQLRCAPGAQHGLCVAAHSGQVGASFEGHCTWCMAAAEKPGACARTSFLRLASRE
jgi:hypothetical protein